LLWNVIAQGQKLRSEKSWPLDLSSMTPISCPGPGAGDRRCVFALRWRALTRYLDDGKIGSATTVPRGALRTICLGRNNFIFAGSHDGGERAAAIYTLTGSATLNGLDP
jgi:hypothetical protein